MIYPPSETRHIVSVSSGAPSALLAFKVIEKYGAENVDCIFADTLAEHEDNYRFLYDLRQRGLDIIYLTHGKTPNRLQRDQQTIFNNFLAPCTRILKLEPIREFVQWRQRQGYVVKMHVGYTLEDTKPKVNKPEGRVTDTRAAWLSNWVMPEFLLVDEQYSKQRVKTELKEYGIQVTETYANGMPNANCLGKEGGGCVKGGKGYMLKVLIHYPDSYASAERMEHDVRVMQYRKQRARGVRVADIRLYSRLRETESQTGLSLRKFRENYEKAQAVKDKTQLKLFTLDADGELCGAECGVSEPERWAA